MAVLTARIRSASVRYLKLRFLIKNFFLNAPRIFKYKESNKEWNRCIDSNAIIFGRCWHGCDSDNQCKNDCAAEFEEIQLSCPCEVGFSNIVCLMLLNFRKIVLAAVLVRITIALKPPLLPRLLQPPLPPVVFLLPLLFN